ncbi:MAG: hypothetical protein ACRD3M_17420 [Thermoanaerobaculia bacterium]
MNADPEARFPRLRMSLVPILALVLAGCAKAPPPGGASLDPEIERVKDHVKRVVIDANGTAHPDPVQVKQNVEIVVWVARKGELKIEFPNGNPFSQPMACAGRFCGLLLPPNGAPGPYDYTASVTDGGTTQTADPKLEVVP